MSFTDQSAKIVANSNKNTNKKTKNKTKQKQEGINTALIGFMYVLAIV